MIFGRRVPKATAVILLSLTVALNAGLTTCDDNTPGCADYIRAGLGYDGPVRITQTEVEYYTTTDRVTVTAGAPPPPPSQELAAASACSSSWSSYRSRTSANVVYKYVTTTMYQALTTSLTYGRGDVYSTESAYKIPVAHGNFTPTSTAQRVLNITSTVRWATDFTRNKTLAKATPTCELLKPKECSKLYVEYISSLGLPPNASVPKITPAPANSPPCPDYFYKPFSTCQKSFVTSYATDCTIMGNSVELFYFPTQSTTPTQDPSATITQPPEVVYEYAPGTTFTSPSIYLKFDYLSAERLVNADDAIYCTVCDEKGCRTSGVDGGQSRYVEGTSIEGQLVSLAPQEVSSVVLDFHEQEASSIISTMAHNLPGYADVMARVVGNYNVTAKRLNLSDVIHPPPEAYYLQPLDNAPGCDVLAPQPQCSTIFEGAYRALISLPQEVTGLQGAWKSCFPVIYGVYDPPIALTKASYADGPTLPGGYKPTQGPEQTPQTPQTPLPGDLPQIPPIARPTHLPIELPDENSPAGPTLPDSGGWWGGNGGSGNDGDSGNNGGGSDGGGSGGNGGSENDGGSGNNGGSSNTGGSSSNGGSSSGDSSNNGGSFNNGGSSNNGGSFNNGGSSGGDGGSTGGNGGSTSGEGGGSSNIQDQSSDSGGGGGNGSGGDGSGGNSQGEEGSGTDSGGNGQGGSNSGSSSGGNGQGSSGGNSDSSSGLSNSDNSDSSNGSENGSSGSHSNGGGSSSNGSGDENSNGSGSSNGSGNENSNGSGSSNGSGNESSGSNSNGSGSSNDGSSGHKGKPSLASPSIQRTSIHLLAFYTCTIVLLAELLAP